MCYHIFNLYQCHSYSSVLVIPERKIDTNCDNKIYLNGNDDDLFFVFSFPSCSKHGNSVHERKTPMAPLFRPGFAVANQKMDIHFNFFDLIKTAAEVEWIS